MSLKFFVKLGTSKSKGFSDGGGGGGGKLGLRFPLPSQLNGNTLFSVLWAVQTRLQLWNGSIPKL